MTKVRAAEAGSAAMIDADAVAPGASELPPRPWPGEVPTAVEAESEVAAALDARLGDASALVTRVASEVSEIERSAFDGLAIADPALLRSAAALRLRLAAALETAPQLGEFDGDAVQELLASADGVLASLAEESASAPQRVAAAIGAIRTDLVRDAIRVSEAHQRLANPQVAPAVASAPVPQVRLLSNESEDVPAVRERSRRNVGLWVTLLVAVLAAGGYHVNRALETKRAAAAAIRVDGAPERASATTERSAGQLLFTPPGAPLSAAELEKLRAVQLGRGRTVVERAQGVYVLQKITEERVP